MTAPATHAGSGLRLADGVARVFAAELLLLPTGLVTAAVLTRVLGPDGYGLFSLVASFIAWLGLTTTALLARAAVQFVSEREDWIPAATSVLRWRLVVGAGTTTVVCVAAEPIATLLGAPEITPFLRVFSLDLLITNLARAYRDVLTGIGRFRVVAMLSAVRWMVRMILMTGLVIATKSVMAAVVASVGATVAELLMARRAQRIPLRGPRGVTPGQMWSVAAPLLVYGAAMQLYAKVDLLALSALGGSPRDLGHYGAAQNLAIAPGLLSLALAPLLLATLTRTVRAGHRADAAVIARGGLRVALAMLPFAAIVAGASRELIGVIFGPDYANAAPLLTLLFAAAVAIAVMSVAVAILTTAEHARLVSILGLGVVGAALAGHVAFIPQYGPLGAASVTALTGGLGAVLAIILVQRMWGVHAHTTTFRALIIAAPAYWAATIIATPGALALSAKLLLLSAAVVAAFAGLGELDRSERSALWSALQQRWTARGTSHQ